MSGPQPGGPTNFKQSLRRLLGYFGPYRLQMYLILGVTAVSVGLSVAGPKILGEATNVIFAGMVGKMLPAGITKEQAAQAMANSSDEMAQKFAEMVRSMDVIPGHGIDFERLGFWCLLALGFYLVSAILGYVTGMVTRKIIMLVGLRLREDVAKKVERVPLKYLDHASRGDLLSRVTNDVDNITNVLNQSFSQLINNVFTLVGILGMMLWVSWKLAIIALVLIPVSGFLGKVVMGKAQPHFGQQWQATGAVAGIVEEAFTGSEVVRLYGLKDDFSSRFAQSNRDLQKSSALAQIYSMMMMPLIGLVSNLTYVAIAVFGGLQVANGHLSLGSVQAFIQYSRQFNQPLSQLMQIANQLQSALASAERVFEFLDAPEMRPEPARTKQQATGPGVIKFEHVSFGYEPNQPVIKDLNLTVEPGHSVAIVGPTGAGKTTLVNLLMRFYELDSGRITIDGQDIAQMNTADLRARMGMVLQDTWLMDDTIAANIAFGKPGASRQEVEASAKATEVHHLISTLPDGYDTVGAEMLSQGEKQLITIARAFIADPQILILDEATSSVDTRTEVLVAGAMNRLRTGRTSFVIAHRLSTIRDADTILVMEKGEVVEQGNHEELLAAQGAYARLCQAQFAES